MFNVPSFGSSAQTSDVQLILTDLLQGMGDYFTQEPGSLNYIECWVYARALAANKQFINLMANQLTPATSSIYLDQWAQIYNISSSLLLDSNYVKNYVEFKQSLFGQPPTYSNLVAFFQQQLGPIFIDLEVRPELQQFATTDPTVQIEQDGYAYSSPLSAVMVYVWQPRDNQDNLLMPTNIFNSIVDSYHAIIEAWNPSYIEFITMNLTNRGNQDGYGNNYNGLNYNNYVDGFNVVSGVAGSNVITGINTVFQLYYNGRPGDFAEVSEGFNPPIQIVDDNNVLQTYFVLSVSSNTSLTLTTKLINNVTSRTYRTLGFVFDTPGTLDASLFNF
jgi:hypothetical protein